MLDLAASALNAVAQIDHLGGLPRGSLRSRPPRFFAEDGVLRRYNAREAAGGVILFMVQLVQEQALDEEYVYHARLEQFKLADAGEAARTERNAMRSAGAVNSGAGNGNGDGQSGGDASAKKREDPNTVLSLLVTTRAVRVLQGHNIKWELRYPGFSG